MTYSGCLYKLCMAITTMWKCSMVPVRKQDENFMKNKKIHDENNVWSTAQRFDVHVGYA